MKPTHTNPKLARHPLLSVEVLLLVSPLLAPPHKLKHVRTGERPTNGTVEVYGVSTIGQNQTKRPADQHILFDSLEQKIENRAQSTVLRTRARKRERKNKKEKKKKNPRVRLPNYVACLNTIASSITAARQSPHCVSVAPDLTTSRRASPSNVLRPST